MSFSSLIRKIFGSKAERDIRQIRPILDRVLVEYESIDRLSNDELRAKTEALKGLIRERVKAFEVRIEEIRAELEMDIPVSRKEELATEADKLVKDEDEAIEAVLNEILPQVFAIMKSTARRFAQNEEIEVTANELDKKWSVNHDFVRIEGEKAVYSNHWQAGGNEVTWDMVHYDVQLIGGIVLHQERFRRWLRVRVRLWWLRCRCS